MTNKVNSSTTLATAIATMAIYDTHEHLITPAAYIANPPDIIAALFGLNAYIQHDLISAGCSYPTLAAFLDAANPDIAARWHLIAPHWADCQQTGYAEAVRLSASILYDIDTITAEALVAAQPRQHTYTQPGQYQHLLEQVANLATIQIDAFTWETPAGAGDERVYRYDINVCNMVNGTIDFTELATDVGFAITNLADYARAIQHVITHNAPQACAIKTQHAYNRTLAWQLPDAAAVVVVFDKKIRGAQLGELEACMIGDWALDQIATQAAIHHLPIKIHTGHFAGNRTMPIDWVRPGQLSQLIKQHPDTTFVLMHIGYPYQHELLSMAKHYANVYVDLCWAWGINPRASSEFVRQWIHSVPINKLFGFGGDAFLPTQTVGFAAQTRQWLTRTLNAEVAEGYLSEAAAIRIAQQLLFDNQHRLFGQG
ncbi:MAG: amidohydrolase family protein [Chloroflexales bacterium]|nr:amidohydrolase family protein [Chloroflexales bacterium]